MFVLLFLYVYSLLNSNVKPRSAFGSFTTTFFLSGGLKPDCFPLFYIRIVFGTEKITSLQELLLRFR